MAKIVDGSPYDRRSSDRRLSDRRAGKDRRYIERVGPQRRKAPTRTGDRRG